MYSSSLLPVPRKQPSNPAGHTNANANATHPSHSNKIAARREHPSVTMQCSLPAHCSPSSVSNHPTTNTHKKTGRKSTSASLCMINVPSNPTHPALGRHLAAREQDVTHALPLGGQAQLRNVQPNVGDRLNRPQRGDDGSDRLVGRPRRRPMEGQGSSVKKPAAESWAGRHFRAREDHVMAALGGQEACSRDSFRKLV